MQDDETPPARVKRRWLRAAELLGLVRQEDSPIAEPTPWWASIICFLFGVAVAVTVTRWLTGRESVFDGSWLLMVAAYTVVAVLASRLGEAWNRRRSAGGTDRDS